MSEARPFFIVVPWEFYDAWLVDRRVNQFHVLTALYVAARCFEARNTGGGIAPVELSTVARLCDVTPETIRRRLHDLRAWGWLDFQAGDGGDPAWKIWLTGLSLEEPSPRPLHDLSTETPPPQWRGLSTDSPPPTSANPHGQKESPPPTSPQSETRPLHKRYETRPEKNYVRREDEARASLASQDEREPADWRRLYEELITEGVDKREARVIAHALADDEAGAEEEQ